MTTITLRTPVRNVTYCHISEKKLEENNEATLQEQVAELIESGEADSDFSFKTFECALAQEAIFSHDNIQFNGNDIILSGGTEDPISDLTPFEEGDMLYVTEITGEGEYDIDVDTEKISLSQLRADYHDCQAIDTYTLLDESYLKPLCNCLEVDTIRYPDAATEVNRIAFTPLETSSMLYRIVKDASGEMTLEILPLEEESPLHPDLDDIIEITQEREAEQEGV
jgi:hypothetical protein